MDPYISIVMAVYNNEQYFPNAVKSVMNQTFNNWELIIIDDGSTDKTPQIADDFAKRDKRIKVIHQNNQWIFRSYNNGYAAASGKYVFIVNSDDTINNDALKNIHNIAEKSDADIILFNLMQNRCDENQNILEKDLRNMSKLLKEDFIYTKKDLINGKWIELLKLKLLNRQCVYKTTIAKKYKYYEQYFMGDCFYNIQIADEINVAAGTNYIVYNHFFYAKDQLNASAGKYYGYEHEMLNKYYFEYRDLFIKWNRWKDEELIYISAQRLQHLTWELIAYNRAMCSLKIEEKLEKIMKELSDDVVYNCAVESNLVEEYESRILSGLRSMFIREIPDENSKYYFFYQLLDKILAYEKDEEDMEIIRKVVYNPYNPRNIGQSFYKKLIGEKSE